MAAYHWYYYWISHVLHWTKKKAQKKRDRSRKQSDKMKTAKDVYIQNSKLSNYIQRNASLLSISKQYESHSNSDDSFLGST